jgi:hypothetical protein
MWLRCRIAEKGTRWIADWTASASLVVFEPLPLCFLFVAGFFLELKLPKYSREYFGNYSEITYEVDGTVVDKAIIAVN